MSKQMDYFLGCYYSDECTPDSEAERKAEFPLHDCEEVRRVCNSDECEICVYPGYAPYAFWILSKLHAETFNTCLAELVSRVVCVAPYRG
jgi:hypothetical protein